MRAGWKDLGHSHYKRDLGIITLTVSWEDMAPANEAGYRVKAGNFRHKKRIPDMHGAMDVAEDLAKRRLQIALDKLKEV